MAAPGVSSFIWSVVDLLRGDYKQSKYGKVIVPFTVRIKAWVWSFGAKAGVLEPLSLRQEIAQEVTQLHPMYRPAPARSARRLPR